MDSIFLTNKHLKRRIASIEGFDDALAELMKGALDFMTPRQLGDYIDAVDRFNRGKNFVNTATHPGEFLINLGAGERIHWANLRNDLEVLPRYFTAMSLAGVDRDSAFSLVMQCHTSQKYDFGSTSQTVRYLADIATTCREKKIDLQSGLPRLHDLVDLSHKEGEQLRIFGIFQLALKAGFSIDQAATTIEDIHVHSWNAGYGMIGLYDELDAMKTHSLEPTLLFNALSFVTKSRGSYTHLAEGLATAATMFGPDSTRKFITNVIEAGQHLVTLNDGDANLPTVLQDEQGDDPVNSALRALEQSVNATGGKEQTIAPDDYFPDIGATRLVHGALPYRIKRSLQAGIEDLRELGACESVEGAFIFDRPTETWFSLGGKSCPKEDGRGYTHMFRAYDISQISTDPLFVHIHPQGTEIYVCPPREALSHTCMQRKLTRFFAAVPSAADFNLLATLCETLPHLSAMRGLIVTSSGLTTFVAPNDATAVKAFAGEFLSLKDQVLLGYDLETYLRGTRSGESEECFARNMVSLVNSKLPRGFQIQTRAFEEAFVETPRLERKLRAGCQPV